MKTLRVLFLAVLAMALMVSGAFADATPLPTDSFDVYIGGAKNATAKTTLSADILSSDTVKAISFDFTKAVEAGYVVSYDEDDNFAVTSEDGKIVTLTFTPTDATKAQTAPFTFNFYKAGTTPSDDDEKTGAITISDLVVTAADPVVLSTDNNYSADITVKVTLSAVSKDLLVKFSGESDSTDIKVASKNVSSDTTTVTTTLRITGKATVSGDTNVKIKAEYGSVTLSKDIKVENRSADKKAAAATTLFEERLLRQSYAAAADPAYTLKFTVNYKVTGSSESDSGKTTGTPGIDWASASAINNKTWTLYLSADKAGVEDTVKVAVSSDFTAAPALVISPDKNDYVTFTKTANSTATTSGDNKIYAFTVTATPVGSADTTGSTFTVYATVTSGSVYKTSELSVKVLVSDDTSSDVTPGDDVVTDWELTVTADKTSFDLSYYGEAVVTITAKPSDVEVEFSDDADDDEDYTLEEEDAEEGTTAYTKQYTFTAGETEGDYEITFTVKATSGDKTDTKSVTVAFSVAFDEENQATPKKPSDKTAEYMDMYLPAGVVSGEVELTFSDGTYSFTLYRTKEARQAAFDKPRGKVAWILGADYPVHRRFGKDGWWQYFIEKLLRALDKTFEMKTPKTYGAQAGASVAVDNDSGVDSRDSAVVVGFIDDQTAVFEVDVEKAKSGLPEGDRYNVETTYTPKAAVEAAGDNAEPSTPDVAGEMDGKQDTSGNGGTDPTNPETIDEILGGSSGGCDAGFGALALALAATLFVSKKRS